MLERRLVFSVGVIVDDRTWDAKYWVTTPAMGTTNQPTSEFWTVGDGQRQEILQGAPALGVDRDPEHWAVLLEPYVKRTIYNHGW